MYASCHYLHNQIIEITDKYYQATLVLLNLQLLSMVVPNSARKAVPLNRKLQKNTKISGVLTAEEAAVMKELQNEETSKSFNHTSSKGVSLIEWSFHARYRRGQCPSRCVLLQKQPEKITKPEGH